MKRESFENPWFLREFELSPAQDRRLEKITKIMGDNPQLIDTFYQQLQYIDRDANFQNLSSKRKEKEKAKSGDIQKSFARMLKPDQTKPEQDHYKKTIFDRFIGAVIDAPGDTAKKLRFVRSYGQIDYINIKDLNDPELNFSYNYSGFKKISGWWILIIILIMISIPISLIIE